MNAGWFTKEHTPWNKGNKDFRPSPDTEFKKGQNVGKDHHSWKGGVQVMTHDCVYLSAGPNKRVRRPRVIYEEAYGPIPKGYVIYHRDVDKNNDDADNLEAISRAELIKRNRNL